jgi:hypothetical protein
MAWKWWFSPTESFIPNFIPISFRGPFRFLFDGIRVIPVYSVHVACVVRPLEPQSLTSFGNLVGQNMLQPPREACTII